MIKNKFFRWTFFLSSCIFFVFLSASARNKTIVAEENKTLNVGIYDNKPKVYLDDDYIVHGLFPDILNYIAQQENWQIHYIFGTWDQGLDRLEKGEIDLMVDVAFSKERQEKYDFTNDTVFNSWGVIFTGKKSEINSFKDLDRKKIAVLESSIYYGGSESVDTYLSSFGLKADFIKVPKQTDVFELINNGGVDAGVVSRIFALANQKDYPNIRETEIFFSPTELRFALTKGKVDNPYLIDRIDYWVKKLKEGHEGVYQKILEDNGLSGMTNTKEVIPKWVPLAGLVGTVIFLLLCKVIVELLQARITAKQKLEAILASIGEGLFVVDLKGKLILVNRAFEDLLGWKKEEALGKKFVELVPAQDGEGNPIPDYKRPISYSILTGKENDEFSTRSDYFLIKKDKTRIPIAYKVTLVTIKGKTIGAVGVFRDITNEREIDRAKTEFVSVASHQLRTPLGIAKWYLEAAKEDKYIEKGPESVKEYLNEIYKSNERLILLVRDLLSVSRIDQRKIRNNPKLTNVVQLMMAVIKETSIIAMQKNIKVNLTVKHPEIPSLKIDPFRLHEVIENLIINAIEYNIPSGSVEVNVEKKDNKLQISVKDTGIGLSEKDKKNLFTKFFRSEKAVSQNPDGSGLGLYVVKSYVEDWGGKLSVVSNEGKGSTFTITIPIS